MTRPIFKVRADGVDFTMAAAARLLSLSVTDAAGSESDTVSIEIADPGGRTEPPRKGAIISVAMGWADTGLVNMGTYTADTPKLSGFPERISITGRAADQRQSLKQHRTQGWPDTTLGEIAQEIAGRNGLSAAVSGELASQRIPFVGQSEESDQHFLRRVAERFGAFTTVKEGRLIVVPRGQGKSASGIAVQPVVITRNSNLLAYSCTLPDRPGFSNVKASWADRPNAQRPEVSAPAGETGPDYTIREPFASEAEAQAAAEAKADQLKRGEGTFSCTLVFDPYIRGEAPLTVSGLRPGANGAWSIERAKHTIQDSGSTTQIEADKGKSA